MKYWSIFELWYQKIVEILFLKHAGLSPSGGGELELCSPVYVYVLWMRKLTSITECCDTMWLWGRCGCVRCLCGYGCRDSKSRNKLRLIRKKVWLFLEPIEILHLSTIYCTKWMKQEWWNQGDWNSDKNFCDSKKWTFLPTF